ncbi:purine permease 3-like [Ananas comosus]|uniref:Probable purine permease n=1 Tax=Ananas comosus TaxID=4615 RepID=A0A6P5GE83_ANACO|nr:purine permease 3-like [Ananas comosus]
MAIPTDEVKDVAIAAAAMHSAPPPPPPLQSSSSLSSLPRRMIKPSPLVLLNGALMLLGGGGPLLLRLYFVHGGHRLWLPSLLQLCGWPLLLLPLSFSYLRRRTAASNSPHLHRRRHIAPPLAAAFVVLGLLNGLDCYLYAFASSDLPLSTSSLLISTQLAFTAFFAFAIVRQRFTAYSANAVVLLTLGPAVLSLGSRSDRPVGESAAQYSTGFILTVAAAALFGLLLPLMEGAMRRWSKEEITYTLLMELQLVLGVAGTAFCLVGMVVSNDFKAIPKEAREFGLGETKYYMVLIWDALFWQAVNMGMVGVICCASSLLAGIMIAILLPLSEILAVMFLGEKFDGSKGVALALSLWGFISYLYGEKRQGEKKRQAAEVELPAP